jgi:hypothetical protein
VVYSTCFGRNLGSFIPAQAGALEVRTRVGDGEFRLTGPHGGVLTVLGQTVASAAYCMFSEAVHIFFYVNVVHT